MYRSLIAVAAVTVLALGSSCESEDPPVVQPFASLDTATNTVPGVLPTVITSGAASAGGAATAPSSGAVADSPTATLVAATATTSAPTATSIPATSTPEPTATAVPPTPEPTATTVPPTPVPPTATTAPPASVPVPPTAIPQPAPSSCVDINSASHGELQRIIHIGPDRATQILSLRPFSSVDSMTRISGIAAGRLADIKAQGLACVR